MPTAYKAPKLTFDKDFTALVKSGKTDAKNLDKLADAIKAALENESKAVEGLMTDLLTEAKKAYANLERISLERNAALAGQKLDVLIKLQRDTVSKVREAGEASRKEFDTLDAPCAAIKETVKTSAKPADFKDLLKRIDKYSDRYLTAHRLVEGHQASIVALDTKASAKTKEIMASAGAYAGDVKTFDKKIDDLRKKCVAAMESFLGCCARMQSAKDEKELLKHVADAIALKKALGPAVDAFVTLAQKHPDPANSNVATVRKALSDNITAANNQGLKAFKTAFLKLRGKEAAPLASDFDLTSVIARLK